MADTPLSRCIAERGLHNVDRIAFAWRLGGRYGVLCLFFLSEGMSV